MAAGLDAVAATNLGGVWKVHPAADIYTTTQGSHVMSSFAAGRFTYHVMRGRNFTRAKASGDVEIHYDLEFNYLFRSDAEHPEKGVYAVSEEVPLNGDIVQLAAYSPASGCLVVVYNNGALDVVNDADQVCGNKSLCELQGPFSRRVRSITFSLDGNRAFIATDFGYAEINLTDGSLIQAVNIGRRLDYVAEVGDNLVIAAPVGPADESTATSDYTGIFMVPRGVTPTLDDSRNLKLNLAVAASGNWYDAASARPINPQTLQPLSAKSFLFTAGSGTQFTTVVATLGATGEADAIQLGQLSCSEPQGAHSNVLHNYLFESLVSPFKDGVMVSGTNGIYLVNADVDVDPTAADPLADFRTRGGMRQLTKSFPSPLSNESARNIVTFDGHTFHIYEFQKGFYTRTVDYDATSAWNVHKPWSAPTETIPVVGNPNCQVNSFASHPQLGVLMRGNPFNGKTFYNDTNDDLDDFCAFKDGKWTLLAPHQTTPANSVIISHYNRHTGCVPDPCNPDWIYSSHLKKGLFRMNLKDPDDVLVIGKQTGGLTSIPGFIPQFTSWWICVAPTEPEFDVNGNMWLSKNEDSKSKILYWTKEDRMATADAASNHDSYLQHPIKQFDMSAVSRFNTGFRNFIRPMTTPGHENILIMGSTGDVNSSIRPIIYDHNGTIEDTSDDRVADFNNFMIEGEMYVSDVFLNSVREDTTTGDIWFMTNRGILYASPEELFGENPTLKYLKLHDSGSGHASTSTEAIRFRDLAIDPQGRKWVSSDNGVICISSDNKRILGSWSSDNSVMPVDRVEAIFADPATGDIWIACLGALVQFSPDGSDNVSGQTAAASASPSVITPDYNGYVLFTGLSDGKSYSLTNLSGVKVAELGSSSEGRMQWLPRIPDGGKLPTGTYTLSDNAGNAVCTLSIMTK